MGIELPIEIENNHLRSKQLNNVDTELRNMLFHFVFMMHTDITVQHTNKCYDSNSLVSQVCTF